MFEFSHWSKALKTKLRIDYFLVCFVSLALFSTQVFGSDYSVKASEGFSVTETQVVRFLCINADLIFIGEISTPISNLNITRAELSKPLPLTFEIDKIIKGNFKGDEIVALTKLGLLKHPDADENMIVHSSNTRSDRRQEAASLAREKKILESEVKRGQIKEKKAEARLLQLESELKKIRESTDSIFDSWVSEEGQYEHIILSNNRKYLVFLIKEHDKFETLLPGIYDKRYMEQILDLVNGKLRASCAKHRPRSEG